MKASAQPLATRPDQQPQHEDRKDQWSQQFVVKSRTRCQAGKNGPVSGLTPVQRTSLYSTCMKGLQHERKGQGGEAAGGDVRVSCPRITENRQRDHGGCTTQRTRDRKTNG